MKALNIDFAPVHGAGHRSGTRYWVLAAVIFLFLAVAGGVVGNSLAKQAAAMRVEARGIDASRDAERSAAQVKEQLAPDLADAINGAIRMLNYPLIGMLGKLERHARPEVALMSVELGPLRSNLRLVIQAAGLPQALDFLEALRREPGFENTSIIRQEVGAGEGMQAWRFTLETPQPDGVPRSPSRVPGRGQE